MAFFTEFAGVFLAYTGYLAASFQPVRGLSLKQYSRYPRGALSSILMIKATLCVAQAGIILHWMESLINPPIAELMEGSVTDFTG